MPPKEERPKTGAKLAEREAIPRSQGGIASRIAPVEGAPKSKPMAERVIEGLKEAVRHHDALKMEKLGVVTADRLKATPKPAKKAPKQRGTTKRGTTVREAVVTDVEAVVPEAVVPDGKRGPPFSIRLSDAMLARLKWAADRDGLSRSAAAVQAITLWVVAAEEEYESELKGAGA